MEDRKQWFIERVWKVVYGTKFCNCKDCEVFHNLGIDIPNKDAALNLYEHEILFQAEGTKLKYFDTKEERAIYEKENGL